LGEACTGRVLDHLDASPDGSLQNREQLANALATRLLLPMKWFARAAAELDHDLIRLKERFSSASHELIARRMLNLPTRVVVSIFDHGKLHFRRCNRQQATPRLTSVEASCWLQAHDAGEVIRRQGAPRIDVWPVHEPDWKREIMRMELPQDEQIETAF
jgi:hypothetical protein